MNTTYTLITYDETTNTTTRVKTVHTVASLIEEVAAETQVIVTKMKKNNYKFTLNAIAGDSITVALENASFLNLVAGQKSREYSSTIITALQPELRAEKINSLFA